MKQLHLIYRHFVKIIFLLLIVGFIFNSCRKDYYLPVAEVDLKDTVYFAADLIPIFTVECSSVNNCHGSGEQTPELTAENAYNNLMNLGYVETDTAKAEESALYKAINSSSSPMPPDGKMGADKIGKILAWIKQGALNN